MTAFAARLLDWYDEQGRKDLPWHHDRTAYRVWLSEIMLQQTQVNTVIPYFEKFVAQFPDVRALAGAPLDEVLRLWSGLGYYARARNLHRAARTLMDDFNGRFPPDQAALESLPGVGRSTAGAILAQAFDIRAPILDGNAKRVLARFHAVPGWPGRSETLRRLWQLAEAHTPDLRVRDYTQAIMDLGALVCTRSRPDCGSCPQQAHCEAYRLGRPQDYPEPKPRKALPRKLTWMLMLEDRKGRLLLERRPPSGIWGGLWSLPEADPALDVEALPDYCARAYGVRCGQPQSLEGLCHTFSHYQLQIQPALLKVEDTTPVVRESGDRCWLRPPEIVDAGVPTPIRKLVTRAGQQPSLL